MKKQEQEQGKHLILNFMNCAKMPSMEELYDALVKAVDILQMKILVPPHIVQGAKHLPGITGVCIIETSHLTVHTFSATGFIAIDVYSCRDYDEKKVIALYRKRFMPATWKKWMIRR